MKKDYPEFIRFKRHIRRSPKEGYPKNIRKIIFSGQVTATKKDNLSWDQKPETACWSACDMVLARTVPANRTNRRCPSWFASMDRNWVAGDFVHAMLVEA